MSVTFLGLDEFLSGLDQFAGDVDDLPEREQAGALVAAAAAAASPRLTGEMAGSIAVKVGPESVAIFATAGHAAPIIAGVPSHNIEPHPIFDGAIAAREGEITAVLERGVQDAAGRAGL